MNNFLIPRFSRACSFGLHVVQVIGGIDDQIPSLPITTGVQILTYSKLLSQVATCPSLSSCHYDFVATLLWFSGRVY